MIKDKRISWNVPRDQKLNFSNLGQSMSDTLATNHWRSQLFSIEGLMTALRKSLLTLETWRRTTLTQSKLKWLQNIGLQNSALKHMCSQLLQNSMCIILFWETNTNLLGKTWIKTNTTMLSLGVSIYLDFVILWLTGLPICSKLSVFLWEDLEQTLTSHSLDQNHQSTCRS